MRHGRLFGSCIFMACLAISAGCSENAGRSALYVLEELEAASAVDNPEERVERLDIFTRNHPDHPYRVLGYRRILETLARDVGDIERANEYFDGVLEKESDHRIRGDFHYARFAYLWESDSKEAFSLAKELLEGNEEYYRLFLYMGYYFMEDEGDADLAEMCLRRAGGLAPDSAARARIMGVLGGLLEREGREDEALDLLKKAAGDTYANEALGRILWKAGNREEALEAYIRLAAGAPGSREDVGLDSLYALVYPAPSDLDDRILEARIGDRGLLPDRRFVDIDGRSYNLADYRGSNLVLSIFSPT